MCLKPMSRSEREADCSTVVELNLRLPSMLHGKKGFERIVWAFKNVLNQSVAWLFYDLESDSTQDGGSTIRQTATGIMLMDAWAREQADQETTSPVDRLSAALHRMASDPYAAAKWGCTVRRSSRGRTARALRCSVRMDCHGPAWIFASVGGR